MGHAREHRLRASAGEGQPAATPAAPEPTSPARQHKLQSARVQPAVTGAASAHQAVAGATAEFDADLESLHGLSDEARLERKKSLVTKWRGHVEAFLNAGRSDIVDPVSAWYAVWLGDIGEIGEFIGVSRAVEALGQKSPFATPLNEFRWRRVADWAWDEIKAKRGPEPYLGEVCKEADTMPPSLAAFYAKLQGEHQVNLARTAADDVERHAHLEAARGWFERAMELNGEKSRVKTILGNVVEWISGKKQMPTGVNPGDGTDAEKPRA